MTTPAATIRSALPCRTPYHRPSMSSATHARYSRGIRKPNARYPSHRSSGGRPRHRTAQPASSSPHAARTPTRVAPGPARSISTPSTSSACLRRHRGG